MDFDRAIVSLNAALQRKRPARFSSSWIARQEPALYRLLCSVRMPLDGIDWDAVTRHLERSFQKRWFPRRCRKATPYTDSDEVQRALGIHAPKRYVFVTALDEEDKRLRDLMSIRLVRLAQRGNIAAHDELLELLPYTIQTWIESCPPLRKWNCYREDLDVQVRGCIRRFRYAGSFMGYLFKTLLCAGRGLRPLEAPSLDGTLWESEKRRVENVVQDPETGDIALYHSSASGWV
jgi:hypothetical protein